MKIISEIIPEIVPKTYFEESYLGGKRCVTKEASTYSELFDYFVPEFVPKTVSKTVPKCVLKTNFQGILVAKGVVLNKSQHF